MQELTHRAAREPSDESKGSDPVHSRRFWPCYDIFMSKNILILLGHPDASGLCGTIAETYEKSAREAGHSVTRMNIGQMQFDPILHKGYRAIQDLEPDLKLFQERLAAADHFVIIHPVWWTGMPAILKGLFDRAWLPGSAFRYIKIHGKNTIFWHRLYRSKTARLVVTSGSHPWLVRMLPGTVNAQLRWGILWFAGFRVRTTWYGPSEHPTERQRARWIRKISYYGKHGI